jgi:DNA-binding transcriptional LysR family regulator
MVGELASRILQIAPGVTLEFRPSGTLDLVNLLDRGEIDMAIGTFAEQGERFSRELLLQDDFVVVLRKNHPATRRQTVARNVCRAIASGDHIGA